MRDLKKYAQAYDCEFIPDIGRADVVFTNDVFTHDVMDKLARDIPRVKRMDGVFFQECLRARNESLNLAAQEADTVIFISEFSKNAYTALYSKHQPLKGDQCVILNWVDSEVFKFQDRSFVAVPERFVAISTSWRRAEKRLGVIIELARRNPHKEFHLIGDTRLVDGEFPTNIFSFGYIEDESILCDVLCDMDAMICTAFRDAAPKTVAQGLAVGLPVFYANSGGVPELVRDCGLAFDCADEHRFYDEIPCVSDDVFDKFDTFCDEYNRYVTAMHAMPHRYQDVLRAYFDEFRRVL